MQVELRSINDIRPYEKNPRQNDQAVDALVASLKAFGFRQPIVVDAEGVIIVGHTRWKAAQKLGLTQVPVHVATDLTPEQVKAYRIADNQTATLAEWDMELLPLELKDLQALNFDLSVLGFSQDDLAAFMAPEGTVGLTDQDAVPEPPDVAVTKRGDLIILGNNRLYCGDSGSVEDLDRLLDGAVIDCVNTDPPYNVKVEPRSNNAIAAGNSSFAPNAQSQMHHQSFDVARRAKKEAGKGKHTILTEGDAQRVPSKYHGMDLATGAHTGVPTTKKMRAKDRPLANDFVSDEAFDEMLRAWFTNLARVLKPGGSFYVWGGYANLGNYPGPLKAAGLYFSQAIVWDKCWPVLSRKNYLGAFEICFFGWREGAGHDFYGPNNETDLWHIKKDNPASYVHLTQKPVELAARAINNSSRPGENVLDLFGGSGSTLIACEQTGRHAFLMELDPPYCDVIVKRWEDFTGRKAERIAADVPSLGSTDSGQVP